MADADAPIQPLRNEPVALLDIAKAVVAVAAFAGIEWADETVLQVVVGVNAAIVLVAATLATRRRVTPEAKAVDREAQAYTDGLEVGKAQAPQVTVVEVDGDPDVTHIAEALKQQAADSAPEPGVFQDTNWDRMVPRYPAAPPADDPAPFGGHGRAGLLDGVDP